MTTYYAVYESTPDGLPGRLVMDKYLVHENAMARCHYEHDRTGLHYGVLNCTTGHYGHAPYPTDDTTKAV